MEEATMAEDAKPPPPRPERRRRQFISVRQRLVNKRALQAEKASVPDPWLSRKFAVGIVLAIYCWSYYVVVGRVCTPGLRGEPGRKFGKGAAGERASISSVPRCSAGFALHSRHTRPRVHPLAHVHLGPPFPLTATSSHH